ncbi:hypothetical protein QVD17_39135 [Tagetes erecta]|uniref:Serpin domain-containing protein n=1 Tax=Tagetes erecta TaxID=13708 RepID=A0AAD8JQ66_TARER|nr:hypothetical protein QVD17_39135 [Tagetes erecta]
MDLEQSISKQTQVSITLATHLLINKFPNSNVVFSPFSIHAILSILATGSKGPTRDQLLVFLNANTAEELNSLYSHLVPLIFTNMSSPSNEPHFSVDGNSSDGSELSVEDSSSSGPQLSVANGVWVDKTLSFKPSFKEVVDSVYKAACNQVDFRAKEVENEVNLWAEEQTNGLIKQVIPANAINKFTTLIFANAIYFKGAWSKEYFDESSTEDYDFHLINGTKVEVPFMTSEKDQLLCEHDDFKVLGLPYFKGKDEREFTMYFFLPNAKDGLRSLIEKISSTSDFIEDHIPSRRAKVGEFLIPKFKISIGFEASGMLKEIGLVLPFRDENDYTEMIESSSVGDSVDVCGIHHKSFVEVNEEGTEAAAVSMLFMTRAARPGTPPKIVDFVADHPFLFVIREDVTGVVLFMGQVIDPSVC